MIYLRSIRCSLPPFRCNPRWHSGAVQPSRQLNQAVRTISNPTSGLASCDPHVSAPRGIGPGRPGVTPKDSVGLVLLKYSSSVKLRHAWCECGRVTCGSAEQDGVTACVLEVGPLASERL